MCGWVTLTLRRWLGGSPASTSYIGVGLTSNGRFTVNEIDNAEEDGSIAKQTVPSSPVSNEGVAGATAAPGSVEIATSTPIAPRTVRDSLESRPLCFFLCRVLSYRKPVSFTAVSRGLVHCLNRSVQGQIVTTDVRVPPTEIEMPPPAIVCQSHAMFVSYFRQN